MDLLYMPLLDLQQHLKQELLRIRSSSWSSPTTTRIGRTADETAARADATGGARNGRGPEPDDGRRRRRLGGDPPGWLRRRRRARSRTSASATSRSRSRRATSSDHLTEQCRVAGPRRRARRPRRGDHRQHQRGRLSRLRPRRRSAAGVNEVSLREAEEREDDVEARAVHGRRKWRRCCRSSRTLDPPGVGARDLQRVPPAAAARGRSRGHSRHSPGGGRTSRS